MPYAVLGSPINHSLSPVMQQAAFDHAGLDARYYRIEADEEGLEHAVARMKQRGFGGWNCTIPNKVTHVRAVRRARRIGGAIPRGEYGD